MLTAKNIPRAKRRVFIELILQTASYMWRKIQSPIPTTNECIYAFFMTEQSDCSTIRNNLTSLKQFSICFSKRHTAYQLYNWYWLFWFSLICKFSIATQSFKNRRNWIYLTNLSQNVKLAIWIIFSTTSYMVKVS